VPVRIALVTDFGPGGPYTGQVRLTLSASLPGVQVVELVSDLPPFRPDLAAYLLPRLMASMPSATLYLCVVDPGVGSDREALVLEADGSWLVGPDNGMLAQVARQARSCRRWSVDWRPPRLSDSFHGRDLFAPVAARVLADGEVPGVSGPLETLVGWDWAADLPAVVYIDPYGNLCTGLRADRVARDRTLLAGGRRLGYARTFCEVPPGTPFWYANSFGLVELAVNQRRADLVLGLRPGDPVALAS
jgi:S-adenosylmethionine hydrolase